MDTALYIHVAAASVALAAGFVALAVRKGSKRHRLAGRVFVATMIIMALPAVALSYSIGKPFDVLSGLVTVYMILTALLVFQPKPTSSATALTLLALFCMTGYLAVEVGASLTGVRATDAPAGAGYIFASVLGLAIWGDVRVRRLSLSRVQQVVRHLWRMNFALLLATVSFFGARPHLFPEWMQASGLLSIIAFAPVIVMAFWAIKVKARPSL